MENNKVNPNLKQKLKKNRLFNKRSIYKVFS